MRKPFTITLPATSANLGPAFDAAALAFDLTLRLSAIPSREFEIRAAGRDSTVCGQLDNHLILETYKQVLEVERKKVIPLAIKITNDMPIGKGCGSSAAARLAGIALANHFGKLRWNNARIVGEASRREHHPDNASACWHGGITIARMSSQSEAQVLKVKPRGKWPLLFVIPDSSLSTEDARRVLPDRYSREDAVANIQNAMLLLGAFMQGRPDLLADALQDRIHQPYRAPLCPLLPAAQKLGQAHGVLGVALSGAGPSVLVFLDPKKNAEKAKLTVAEHFSKLRFTAELILTKIRDRGASSAS
jgi:homoserine kinase